MLADNYCNHPHGRLQSRLKLRYKNHILHESGVFYGKNPDTGELMPLGWRNDKVAFDSLNEIDKNESNTPSFRLLSISEDHDAKRVKLDRISPPSGSSSQPPAHDSGKDESRTDLHTKTPNPSRTLAGAAIVELLSSDEETNWQQPNDIRPTTVLGSPSQKQQQHLETLPPHLPQLTGPERSRSTTPRDRHIMEFLKGTYSRGQRSPVRTSILQPSAALDRTNDSADSSEESEESEDDSSEGSGEYVVEAILGHQLSDPRTHPAGIGKKPIPLYKVKWKGYDKPTWEPSESFGDPEMLREYRRSRGLPMSQE